MKLRFVLLGICLLLLSIPALAQDTAEWGDLGLSVEVPDGWTIDDSGDNALLFLYTDDLGIYFYEPRDARSAEDAIDALTDADGFEFGDIQDAEVMGEEAFRVDYESDGFSGFSLAFEFNGNVLLLDAGAYDDRLRSSDEEELQAIIDSISESEGGNNNNNNNSGGDTIESVQDEDSTADDIIEELVDLGLVEDGGDLLFEEDEVDEDSQDLPESYEGGNIAMGAWVSFEQAEDDEDFRICGFVAQASTDDINDNEGVLFIAGMYSDDTFVTFDLDIADLDNAIFEGHDSGVDIEDENQILMIIQNDEVSAYVNGEQVVEGWELDFSAGDDERFAGFYSDLGCTMTNVWAYSFE